MKTRDGRVVTDLRQMRFENNSKSMGIESGRDSRATSRQADDTNNPSPIRGVKEREEEPQNQYNSHPNPVEIIIVHVYKLFIYFLLLDVE